MFQFSILEGELVICGIAGAELRAHACRADYPHPAIVNVVEPEEGRRVPGN